MEKVIEKANYYIMIFLILMVPIFFLDSLINFMFSYNLINFNFSEILWLLIFPLIFIYIYNIVKKKTKLNVFDYIIFILALLNIIVCNNAIDLTTSVWGALYRGEGLLSFICYYLVFLNCKNINIKNNINKFINIFIAVGILQFIFCFIQVYCKSFIPMFLSGINDHMATGFINNANFLGSYVILLLGIVVMKFLVEEKKYKRYFLLSIMFFMNLIFTQSTGPFLAFIAMLLFCFVFLIIKKKLLIKRFLLLLVCLIVVYFTVDCSMRIVYKDSNIEKSYTINYDLKQLFRALVGKMVIYDWPQEDEFKTSEDLIIIDEETPEVVIDTSSVVEQEEFIEEEIPLPEDNLNGLGSGRIMIWRNALKLVPEYFWFGCGIENFSYAYRWHDDITYYDKAHNDYLQVLVCQGIFVFITYLIFLIMIFIKGVKSNNKLTWILLLSFVGYCIQSFTNISVVNVAPYFYMICGLLLATTQKEKVE